MIVEIRTKLKIDTDKWAEIWDTDGQRASDVRRDIRAWARETLEAKAIEEGFLEGNLPEEGNMPETPVPQKD